jgi:hypothetical protein
VEVRGGSLIEIRVDEALVFDSARQAMRAAVDLQKFAEETDVDSNCPTRVGIGNRLRGSDQARRRVVPRRRLNVAARLCGLAQGGEIKVGWARGAYASTMKTGVPMWT